MRLIQAALIVVETHLLSLVCYRNDLLQKLIVIQRGAIGPVDGFFGLILIGSVVIGVPFWLEMSL